MRAMWDCFNTRRSEVPYGRGWEKTYERSGEDGEREMVEWGGWERMAGVLVCCLFFFWLAGLVDGYVAMWRESGVWYKGRAERKQ